MALLNFLKNLFESKNINYNELLAEGALIVDVRNPEEFVGGHIVGSKNFPLPSLSKNLNQLKGEKVITVCRSGMRSEKAKSLLIQHGIEAYNGGSWKNLN